MKFNWLTKINYREVFTRLPLPMLALAASWGVYEYSLLYVPQWVAICTAAAFELTYIGLAVTQDIPAAQIRRATYISLGAVMVSVLYNSISGFMHRNPNGFEGMDNWKAGLEIGMALLHGAPLAIVAYLLSALLLHSEKKPKPETVTQSEPVAVSKPAPVEEVAPVMVTSKPEPVIETPVPVMVTPKGAVNFMELLTETEIVTPTVTETLPKPEEVTVTMSAPKPKPSTETPAVEVTKSKPAPKAYLSVVPAAVKNIETETLTNQGGNDTRTRVIELYQSGITSKAEIGRRIGISAPAVLKHLKAAGLVSEKVS